MRVVGDPVEYRMRPRLAHAIPSDLRNLQRTSIDSRRESHDLSRDNSQAAGAIFLAPVEQHLDSDTDAQKGFAGARDVAQQDLVKLQRAQVVHRGACGADARQDDAVRGAYAFGSVGNLAAMAEMLEG